MSEAVREALAPAPRGAASRYLFDIIEVYVGFFMIVAALVKPNPILYAIDYYVSLVALAAYAYRVALSPTPMQYILITSWEIPSLVPLAVADRLGLWLATLVRVARAARIAILVLYGSDLARLLRGFIRGLALSPLFTLFTMTIVMGSLAYYAVEYGHSVHSYLDALWFTIVTITTVGYGDIVPQTVAGKALTMALMLIGIILWSITIAVFSSAAARHIGRVIARELQKAERRRRRGLEATTLLYQAFGALGGVEDAATACMMAVLSMPPGEFEEFIEELRRRYQAIHGVV